MRHRGKKVNQVKDSKSEAAKSAPAAQKVAVKQEAAPVAATPKPKKIKVLKSDAKYRGAREAWYVVLKEFDGKTEGEFIEATKAKPPALTRNNTAENPTGWLRFWAREGVISLQQ